MSVIPVAPRLRRQSGKGGFGTIISLLILVVFAYACFKLVPVYIKMWDFEDKVENVSRHLASSRADEEVIRKALLDEARRLDLPITADNIEVKMTRETVDVTVDYTMTVAFPGYTWTKQVHNEYSGRVFR